MPESHVAPQRLTSAPATLESDYNQAPAPTVPYPGIEAVIHGNGAVAHVMGQVCGGVIGYPITPSTEISELYEAFRAQGGCNVWGQHPFFFEPEGEHSAQSGALGAALTGGKYISNASSSQGILYGLESHYVTVGKKAAGFVLQVAARSVSRHSLNVMAGHDDVYALLSAGYTVLFASNAQEAADLATIAYRVSALSLIPVANAMDGFATSHIQSEVRLPEPQMLKHFLGDPADRIPAPSEAQRMLYGAKGRLWQLRGFLDRHQDTFIPDRLDALRDWLSQHADAVEPDSEGNRLAQTLAYVPEHLQRRWQRAWLNAYEKGSRQRVPALVDIHNPGMTGGVQNQPDYQAGVVDHYTHFVSDVPRFIRQAMDEYGQLTGRHYQPVMGHQAKDATRVIVGLGSVTDDAAAVADHLRAQGQKVGVISIKQLNPFPEAELVSALQGKEVVTILERCDDSRLTERVTRALYKARENYAQRRYPNLPVLAELPRLSTGIFGLGAHDLQPRHLVAVYDNMARHDCRPLFYLGSQFFSRDPSPQQAAVEQRLRAAYPETEVLALETGPNPQLLPDNALRIRFHSVGGYGTIATGKLLTDILAGVLGLHSKSAPKYGSEKSGAPTNFYITLSPEPIRMSNADLEQVELVISPDHRVFHHTNPLKGLAEHGTFILQSHHTPAAVWQELPEHARRTIVERNIHFYIVDAFSVAREHAPTPDLEIRMMGIAFIGALCGHVDQVTQDIDEEQLLERIQRQIEKKFGAKGKAVVDSNMQVIRDGWHASQAVPYGEFADQVQPAAGTAATIAVSAQLSEENSRPASAGLFDQAYFDQAVGDRFKDGTIGEAPVVPGAGLFMPAGSAAWKEKGLFRLQVPAFNAGPCTGCMECSLACPDAAIPNAVHELHDLLQVALDSLALPPAQHRSLERHLVLLTERVRDKLRQKRNQQDMLFHDLVAAELPALALEDDTEQENAARLIDALAQFPVARTRPFFDAMEKSKPGTGGLFSVSVDPWKCSGCLECVDVCGTGALTAVRQSTAGNAKLQQAFKIMGQLPNTPARYMERATSPGGDTKRLLLDRHNYYTMTSGHGACRGCGEVTALRLVTAVNRALKQQRRQAHIRELETLIDQLEHKQVALVHGHDLDPDDPDRIARIRTTLATLEERLYYLEAGPTGAGPANALIANATGCSSVYASTFPANPWSEPWVNSLFQDTPALAKGLFEGETARQTEQLRAIRIARLELEDHYDPSQHDAFFRYFHWSQFSEEELGLLPTVLSIGGDGASYDIGFGALSRLLITDTPIKLLVLNTGSYSNTGGQASTASFTAQDADLTRFGVAHTGKQEDRKELGLIAAFHPKVLVVQTSTALQGHFLKNLLTYLNYNESPALLDVYTPCMSEHGIADDASQRQARLAVESRMNPVFVHDPRKGETLAERFSIAGNPGIGKDWITTRLHYVDKDGISQLKEIPFTPADFGLLEGRFKKHYRPLQASEDGVPVHEFIDLGAEQRHGRVPFIWSTDSHKRLVRLAVSPAIVDLTEERRRHWRMLEYLAGLHLDRLEKRHRDELKLWKQRYQEQLDAREGAIDDLARGLAELAMAAGAPTSQGKQIPVVQLSDEQASAPSAAARTAQPLVEITDEEMALCTNCKTCYQTVSELFEMTTVVDQDQAKTVSRVIPGVLNKLELTPELVARARRVADECDAEIIHFHAPETVEA